MNDLQIQNRYPLGVAALVCAGISLGAIFTYLGLRVDLIHPVWIYLTLYPLAFFIYIYAGMKTDSLAQMRPNNRQLLWGVVGFALLFRLFVLHAIPSLSTDIYRYVWDGRLTSHWVNPYRWSPWDPRLAAFRDNTIWVPMEYKAYATVYMPVSQLLFAACYVLFHSNIFAFKSVFTLFDIGIIFVIVEILKMLGKDPTRVVWYAWCPLTVIETSLAGHQDVVGVFLMSLAILFTAKKRYSLAGAAVAAAAMTKGFALLIVPLMVRLGGRRTLIAATVALFYLGMPAWVFLPEFMHGMTQYLNYVHVNAGLFPFVDWLISHVTRYHFQITSALTDIVVITATLWSLAKPVKSVDEVIRRGTIVVAVCLLTVPTLFPWYVIWLLPFAAIYGRQPSASIVCLAGVIDLVYVYYIDRAVHWWVPLLEYVPVFALICWEWRRGYWLPEERADDSALESAGASDAARPDLGLSRGAAAT